MEQSNLLILLLIAFIAYCCMMKKSENFPSFPSSRPPPPPTSPPNYYDTFCQEVYPLEREIRVILEECEKGYCPYELLKTKQELLSTKSGLCNGTLFSPGAKVSAWQKDMYSTPQAKGGWGGSGSFGRVVGRATGGVRDIWTDA